ncbi:Bug family tripartite tricarboxylate transporter substrate binding protein [Aliihoeflea aestuarii]|uniref:Bug family tripartite tricarboxylate transporter substrate binding protein n=1 Tax=Aliihoeflea aestuarii TaxID=453840 RepID=UPI0020921E0E|nr:tripartite tricarboxylate transporter substrate binding protein [Aliihoeflea aestuarii]
MTAPPQLNSTSADIYPREEIEMPASITARLQGTLAAAGLGIGVAIASTMPATAQTYPTRTVEVIHAFGPGGGADRFIRAIGESFQAATGRSMIPISIQGGGGLPAAVNFMQRPATGYNLYSYSPDDVINQALGRLDLSDFRPVARIQYDQALLLVAADSPYQSIEDVIEAARAAPGDIKVAVTGAAGFDDAVIGVWNAESGAELTSIPFAAAEMVSNTLGGHIDMMFEEYGIVRGLIEAEDLRPLVVFSNERLPVLPDVPTAQELGYDVTLGRWRGIAVRRDTDDAVVQQLFELLRAASETDNYRRVEEESALQYRSEILGPDEFEAFIEQELETYTSVMRQMGYAN